MVDEVHQHACRCSMPDAPQVFPYHEQPRIKNDRGPSDVIGDVSEAPGNKGKEGVHEEEIDEHEKGRPTHHSQEFFPVRPALIVRYHRGEDLPEHILIDKAEECRAGCGPALSWRRNLLRAPAEEI